MTPPESREWNEAVEACARIAEKPSPNYGPYDPGCDCAKRIRSLLRPEQGGFEGGWVHEWRDSYKSITVPHCAVCGIVRRADGKNKPCRGPVRVGLREDDPYAPVMTPDACGTFKDIPEGPCFCGRGPLTKNYRVHLTDACYPTIEAWKSERRAGEGECPNGCNASEALRTCPDHGLPQFRKKVPDSDEDRSASGATDGPVTNETSRQGPRGPSSSAPTGTTPSSERARELAEALQRAKDTIRALHGEPGWDIYDRCSPEMKAINSALANFRAAERGRGGSSTAASPPGPELA